eukprot:COSAG02_NODE_1714_length_11220_cov_3.198543_14_plen_55_part_00
MQGFEGDDGTVIAVARCYTTRLQYYALLSYNEVVTMVSATILITLLVSSLFIPI